MTVAKHQTYLSDHCPHFFLYSNMPEGKMTDLNESSFLPKQLAMPVQQRFHLANQEASYPLFSTPCTRTHKPVQTCLSPSHLMHIRNPLIPMNYMSAIEPALTDRVQPCIASHVDRTSTVPSTNQRLDSCQSSRASMNSFEDSTILKIHLPIEMMIRAIPEPPSRSDERCHHTTHSWSPPSAPCQASTDWTSRPASSLIRKAQQVFFGTHTSNDRGDVTSNPTRHPNAPSTDLPKANEVHRSMARQPQPLSFNSPASSMNPRRCECGSVVYPAMSN